MGPFSFGRGMGSAVALKYIPPPTPLYRLKRNLRLPPGAESRTIGGDVQQGRILMSSCKRCGQCCRLGGPVLHRDDLSLLDRFDAPAKGTVPFGMADLVTLRTGELVRDDVIGTLTPLESECVKLGARQRPGRIGNAVFWSGCRTPCRAGTPDAEFMTAAPPSAGR